MTSTAGAPTDAGVGAGVPRAVLDHLGGPGSVVRVDRLTGGEISETSRLTTSDGRTVVLKRSGVAPGDLYRREAEGLDALRRVGALRIPEVLLVGPDFLLLEDVGRPEPTPERWATYGRALALQHRTRSDTFGWPTDNYLGLLPQRNPPTRDGHSFFAEHRIIRYLDEPGCRAVLDADDRRRLERLADRLPALIPAQPASLLHGDLWRENMLVGARPAAFDPAVYFGWPDAELAMVRQCGGVPEEFFEAYREAAGIEGNWSERLEVLAVRELLSAVAHLGARAADQVRELQRISRRYG